MPKQPIKLILRDISVNGRYILQMACLPFILKIIADVNKFPYFTYYGGSFDYIILASAIVAAIGVRFILLLLFHKESI